MYTEFEGKEFVIERLFRGSIINYRTFFMEENGICNLRFAADSILKALHKDRMNVICNKYPKMHFVRLLWRRGDMVKNGQTLKKKFVFLYKKPYP